MKSAAQRGRELRRQAAIAIAEFPDRVRATFRPDWNPVYDTGDGRADCARCRHRNYVLVPAESGAAGSDEHPAGDGAGRTGPPSPALHLDLLLPCRLPACNARRNAKCVNKYGEPTRTHKVRRDDARAAMEIRSEP